MDNFTYYNPTKLHFGKDVVNDLGKAVEKIGKKVLLMYGGGSVKNNGSYDAVIRQLNSVNAEVFEYKGIKPNPVIDDVDKAAELGRNKQVDVILALGGGSVIDSAKVTALTIPVEHSGWEFVAQTKKPGTGIPVIAVLTLAATGTEMNMFAVVQNDKTLEKGATGHPSVYPKHSFLDPAYTITVPKNYTGYGIVDLVAHALEAYFGEGDSSLSDRVIYGVINEAIEYGPQLMDDLENYDLRARILLASTLALNGTTLIGKKFGDWGVHTLGHILSVLYDMPHGASLSIVYPAWLRFHLNKIPERISEMGDNLFNEPEPEEAIFMLESYFKSLDSPIRLSEYGSFEDKKQEIIDLCIKNNVQGNWYKFSPGDYEKIFDLML